MKNPKSNPIVRLLPSLTDVAFLMPLAFLFLRMEGAPRMLEGDTGWHIRTGEWILANGRVPDVDFFSFTKPGEPWFAWEWLWDVMFAWLHARGGLEAVVLVSLGVIGLSMVLLYRLTLRVSGNVLVSIGLTLLAMAGSTIHWLARPHLFTMLFLVIFYWVLEWKRDETRNLLWLLPILAVVWTNLHGGFLSGILLIGCYAAGELAEVALAADPGERRRALTRSLPYMLSGAGCFLASFLNPYTYKLHLHMYDYLAGDNSSTVRNVSEWMSVSFHHPAARFFEGMIVLAVAAAAWHVSRRRFVFPLLVVLWAHQALIAGRHIPLFMIVAAPVVGLAMVEVLDRLKTAHLAAWVRGSLTSIDDIAGEIGGLESMRRWHLVSLGAVILLVLVMYAPTPPEQFEADYSPKEYPRAAISALDRSQLTGNVFAPDEWSDYLIYRLYPSTKVYIDGRFDFYGNDFTEEYINLIDVRDDWEEVLRQRGVSVALLPVQSALTSTMKESARWKPVYEDEVAILFQAAPLQQETAGGITSSVAAGRTGGTAASRPSEETVAKMPYRQSEGRRSL